MKFKGLFIGYAVILFGLFLYSFTQVDLSLTLSKVSVWQGIQKSFQYIGYFNRPLSTYLFLIMLVLLFGLYFYTLYLTYKNKINLKQITKLILLSSGVLFLSYNAFSYDLFNYIFDAKIFTHYGQNPYLFKALDFPNDPMLSFMHWTHRVYPYGPMWLVLTVPISFIGFNYFLPTLILFKALAAVFYLGCCFVIKKILQTIDSKDINFNLVFFALNPLILIECLVSAHNDIAMMFFALCSVFYALKKRWVLSFLFIIFAYLTKEVMIVLIVPIILYLLANYIKKIKISSNNFLKLCILFSIIGFIFVLTKIEVQPWYFLWVMPFFALVKLERHLLFLILGLTLGLLLRYAPFLYQGDWNGIVIPIKQYVVIITPLVFLLLSFLPWFKKLSN